MIISGNAIELLPKFLLNTTLTASAPKNDSSAAIVLKNMTSLGPGLSSTGICLIASPARLLIKSFLFSIVGFFVFLNKGRFQVVFFIRPLLAHDKYYSLYLPIVVFSTR